MYWLRELGKTFSKEFISEAASGKFTDKFYLDQQYHRKISFLGFYRFLDDKEKIVLRSSEVEKVIQYYLPKYKGENCYKLHLRIRDSFAGVSKYVIQEWINSNRKHCESYPIFENKDRLQPIIAQSPMDMCQTDLMMSEKRSIKKG